MLSVKKGLNMNYLYRNYRALRSSKKIFIIKDLQRMCWADSKKQCANKFTKHKVETPSLGLQIMYFLFQYMGRKKV